MTKISKSRCQNLLDSFLVDIDSSRNISRHEIDSAKDGEGLLMFGERQRLVQTLPGQVPLLLVQVTDSQVVTNFPIWTFTSVLGLFVRLDG